MSSAVDSLASRTAPQFEKAARRLDKAVLRRIKTYLDEVCELEDPGQIHRDG